MMNATDDKARRAVRRYLEMYDFDIVEEGWCHGREHADFIAEDDGDLVFVQCTLDGNSGDGIPEHVLDRKGFEILAAAYLAEHPETTECAIRCDMVSLLLIGRDKAIIRHHRNALACGVDLAL